MVDRTQRRLAAIVSADVVGYSRLMGVDETGTLAALRAHRAELIDAKIAEHGGRIVKTMGDGLLLEFPSVVDATKCMVEIQLGMAGRNEGVEEDRRITFRVGVNLGDIIVEGEDILGDGVNIAARLQEIADPGGVTISGRVHDDVRNRLDTGFTDVGEQSLKNIAHPIRVWQWSPAGPAPVDPMTIDTTLSPPDEPSIAVLPFQNMSGDPEQDYFADGLTEDIITALSKHHWLEVVARNTTFAYKGKSSDIRQIAKDIGADYIVEGSVRRSGQRIRITAQLIDARSGSHVWAERYDRELKDIFDVQDEITEIIVGRLEPEIGSAIRQKVQRTPRRNLHAWDCYHLGVANFYKFTAEANLEAQRLMQHSRELDPSFAEAHAWWAWSIILGMVYWDTEPNPTLMDEALAAVQQALALDNQSALIKFIMARVQLARREYRSAFSHSEAAVRLNPTLAPALCALGDSLAYEGRYEDSIVHFEKAVELSPNHPQLWAFLSYGALVLLFMREFEKALNWAERASDVPNCQYWAFAHAAVALAYLDQPNEARQMVERLLAMKPAFTRTYAEKKLFYLERPEQIALYLDGLDKAGVPAN